MPSSAAQASTHPVRRLLTAGVAMARACLRDRFSDFPRGYLSIMVDEFPNMFRKCFSPASSPFSDPDAAAFAASKLTHEKRRPKCTPRPRVSDIGARVAHALPLPGD